MISTAKRHDFTEFEAQFPEIELPGSGLNPTAGLAQINSEITRESSKTVQTGHLELQVKYYCNGQLQKSTVTVLETYHKNIRGRETIRRMLQAKASLESQGVNGDLILRSKKGVPLVTIKAKEAVQDAKKTEIFNPKIQPQKLAEILAKSDAKAVIIQSKPQLKEIKKFAERLGIEKIIVPEKMLAEIEYDPRVVSLPKSQAIKISEIAEKHQSAANLFELNRQTDIDVFAALSMPKLSVHAQQITQDDLGFRRDVVDKILGLFAADEEHALKNKLLPRNATIQGKRAAIAIQQMLAAEIANTNSPAAATVKFPVNEQPASLLPKRDLASLYRNLSASRKQAA